MRRILVAISVACSIATTGTPLRAEVATAPTDCPIGAAGKASGAFAWCEPTVCQSDLQCTGGQVCRPVALCVQIGKLPADPGAKDASPADRLIATSRCGPDGDCPKDTVCNKKERCIDRADADRLAPPAASSSAAPSTATTGKKCGCDVVGRADGEGVALFILGVVPVAAFARRRRRSKSVDHSIPSPRCVDR